MWYYMKVGQSVSWTVFFDAKDGNEIVDSEHPSQEEAARRVNYLNGGFGASYPTEAEKDYARIIQD